MFVLRNEYSFDLNSQSDADVGRDRNTSSFDRLGLGNRCCSYYDIVLIKYMNVRQLVIPYWPRNFRLAGPPVLELLEISTADLNVLRSPFGRLPELFTNLFLKIGIKWGNLDLLVKRLTDIVAPRQYESGP